MSIPPLADVVAELEAAAAVLGWDQPARLYALVATEELLAREPGLAQALADKPGGLTAIEQEPLTRPLEQVLAEAEWPDAVAGVAAVAERLVLPPTADAEMPADPEAAAAFANQHPDRQEVRLIAAVTRTGETWCALRLRAHDDAASVATGPDLVPGLLDLLRGSLAPVVPEETAGD